MLRILLIASLIGVAVPAHALDCAKAKTKDEKAICGDAALKAQDAALSQFYFDTLRGLMGERHKLLIDDQRQWLGERAANCEEGDKLPARVACLKTSLAARRRALAICFANRTDGPDLDGKPPTDVDLCPLVLHLDCPKSTLSASPRLATYPWLMQKPIADAKDAAKGGNCEPESDKELGSPDQEETGETITLLAERPNIVSVRIEDDSMSRGAAHPMHGERVVTYDTRTHAEIPAVALLPGLKAGSPLLKKISAAANKALQPSCCDQTDPSFSGIGLDTEEPIPSGWAVSSEGDLILSYDYDALGRDFVATAKVPRMLVIDAVDPKLRDVFVPDPAAATKK